MTYRLDTTTFSELMRRNAKALACITGLPTTDRVAICTITRGEVLYGLERLPRGKRRRNLEAEATHLFSQVPCLTVPEPAADQYAHIKQDAERRGTPLDENDLWIAATALTLGAVLVTTDRDFRRVRSLQTEDWTR